MENKYELCEPIEKAGKTLFRVRALRDFSDVKKGNIGGYVETEDNLSHDNDCWVYDESILVGSTKVIGCCKIKDESYIQDSILIGDVHTGTFTSVINSIINGFMVVVGSIIRSSHLLGICHNPIRLGDNSIILNSGIIVATGDLDIGEGNVIIDDSSIYVCGGAKCILHLSTHILNKSKISLTGGNLEMFDIDFDKSIISSKDSDINLSYMDNGEGLYNVLIKDGIRTIRTCDEEIEEEEEEGV